MPNIKPKILALSMISALEKPATAGLRFVLFKIQAKDYTKGFDYGFAHFDGEKWEEVDPSATVFMWADLPSPNVLF
jgi:hypothetical protein